MSFVLEVVAIGSINPFPFAYGILQFKKQAGITAAFQAVKIKKLHLKTPFGILLYKLD
jgi:hypothetical protein